MLLNLWNDANTGMRTFVLLAIVVMVGIYGYVLFHLAAWSFSTDADTSIQILVFMLSFAVFSLLSAFVLLSAQPAIYAVGLVWCIVWAMIGALIKFIIKLIKHRSHS